MFTPKAVIATLVMASLSSAAYRVTSTVQTARNTDFSEIQTLYGEAYNRASIVQLSKSRGETSLIKALYSEDILELQLFNDLTVEVQKTSVKTTPTGGVFWKGDIIRGEDGYLILHIENGTLSGTLYSSDLVYNINTIQNNQLRVVESDPTGIPHDEKECTHTDDDAHGPVAPFIGPLKRATDIEIVDVMVLYPSSVESSMGGAVGMAAEVAKRVAEVNDIFENSQVRTRFNLVHHQVSSDIPSGAQDATTIASSSEALALREQYKADLVSFWSGNGGSAGNGFNLDGSGSPNDGFNTSKFSLVQTYFTFAHECGHNMGAKHDRAAYGGKPYKLEVTPYYRYGKSFDTYRSVMSYNNCTSSGSCPRVPYYTNPDILVNGAPFGVTGESQTYDINGPANNSRRLNETAEIVSAWKKGTAVELFELTVTDGYGDGSYKEGSTVSITAENAPSGYIFDSWEGDTQYLDDPENSTTTVTIPGKAITLTATYRIAMDIDTSNLSEELLTHAGWEAGGDEYGSAFSEDTSLLSSDNVVFSELTLVADNEASDEYSWAKLSAYFDAPFTDVDVIKVKYQSSAPIRIVLEQEELSEAGTAYSYELPAADSETTVYVPVELFTQPTWDGSLEGDLNMAQVKAVSFEATEKEETTEIAISGLQFTNYNYDDVVLNGSHKSTSNQFALQSISANSLNLTVPQTGNYKASIATLNGRIVFEKSFITTTGNAIIAIPNIRSGVYIISVDGINSSKVFKGVISQ